MTQQHGMAPVTALWICALPVLDTTAVTLNRLIDRRRVNAASRDHLHHLLAARGFSVNQIVLIEATAGFVLGGIGVASWYLSVPEWLMFKLFVGTALAYTLLFRRSFQLEQYPGLSTESGRTGTSRVPTPDPIAVPDSIQRGKVAVTAVALVSLGGALVQPGARQPTAATPAPAETDREKILH
jgi:hypothetical protein